MVIEIRWGEVEKSDALGEHVETQVKHGLRHHADRFTRVDVHIHDDNADKHGADDKRCKIEARPRGGDPLIVESKSDDFYRVVNEAAKKLERSAQHFVDKHRRH